MTNANKAKGSRAERQVADYLVGSGLLVERIPAGATLDRGDLWVEGTVMPTIDVKDHKEITLAAWVDRANEQAENAGRPFGAVWHKRRGKGSPGDWYVTLSGASFAHLLNRVRRAG